MALLNLPTDILTYIFFKLPSESILRLRCVNKLCYELTSSDEFVRAHTKAMVSKGHSHTMFMNISTGSIFQFLCYSCCSINMRHLGLIHHYDRTVASCNELICTIKSENRCLLWHPCLAKRKLLCPFNPPGNCLGITYGFGYDQSNGDYKVVAFCLYRSRSCETGCNHYSVVWVCSSKRNSWRKVHDYFCGGVVGSHSSDFVNGKIHWITEPAYYILEYPRKDIVSFDVEQEMFRVIQEPNYGPYTGYNHFGKTLCIVDSCLSVLRFGERDPVELWVMKEYGDKDSWTKVFTTFTVLPGWNLACKTQPVKLCHMDDNLVQFAIGNMTLAYFRKNENTIIYYLPRGSIGSWSLIRSSPPITDFDERASFLSHIYNY